MKGRRKDVPGPHETLDQPPGTASPVVKPIHIEEDTHHAKLGDFEFILVLISTGTLQALLTTSPNIIMSTT